MEVQALVVTENYMLRLYQPFDKLSKNYLSKLQCI